MAVITQFRNNFLFDSFEDYNCRLFLFLPGNKMMISNSVSTTSIGLPAVYLGQSSAHFVSSFAGLESCPTSRVRLRCGDWGSTRATRYNLYVILFSFDTIVVRGHIPMKIAAAAIVCCEILVVSVIVASKQKNWKKDEMKIWFDKSEAISHYRNHCPD